MEDFKNARYPQIPPISEEVDRPFWSVAIPAYNRVEQLLETLASVLNQALPLKQMQILVVDDASKEDLETPIRRLAGDRVEYYRQPQNVGLSLNKNTCVEKSRGYWIHVLDSDDLILEGFYQRFEKIIRSHPELGAVFCRSNFIDEAGNWKGTLSPLEQPKPGIWHNPLERLAVFNSVTTPSVVVKRSVYEHLGGYHLDLYSCDWDLWKRIAVHYPVWYEPQALTCYREQDISHSGDLRWTGEDIEEACLAIEIAKSYLPAAWVDELSRIARDNHAVKGLYTALGMVGRGIYSGTLAQIRTSLQVSQSPRILDALTNIFQQLPPDLPLFRSLPVEALDRFLSHCQATIAPTDGTEQHPLRYLKRTQPSQVPSIEPVPEGESRPLWSVMIPTYNCAAYLVETLKSVLAQDPGPEQMQIEVVDDCSTQDDPESVVRELGQGRVSFFRQPQNQGAIANFNTCIQRAKGQFVHILHGDDVVQPGFYERLGKGLLQEPEAGSAFCRYLHMDERGHWQELAPVERDSAGLLPNFLEPLAMVNRIMAPSIVVRRRAYEQLGGFHPDLFHSADWDMWKRVIAHFPVWYEPEILAFYRVHSASDASKLSRLGLNITEACYAIDLSAAYLPAEKATEWCAIARERHALKAVVTAHRMLEKGNPVGAIAQIRAGVKCSLAPMVIQYLLEFLQQVITQRAEFNLAHPTFREFLDEYYWLAKLLENARQYQQGSPNPPVLETLRQLRRQIADRWLATDIDPLGEIYPYDLSKAQTIFLESHFLQEPLTEEEQAFLTSLIPAVEPDLYQPAGLNTLLVALLYLPADKILTPPTLSIPSWFPESYVTFLQDNQQFQESLNLQEINLLACPDWTQPEEILGEEMANLLRALATQPDRQITTLLLYVEEPLSETADMLLSSLVMQLLMEEEIDLESGPIISFVSYLSPQQWQWLRPQLQGEIRLPHKVTLPYLAESDDPLPIWKSFS